ncbi:response regulator [Novosphingobium mangrovi (ex Huang et al. 2023)]|uniref:Response regulator n=1 Tax=Novosphingobium mangrovi (ex Huang et al. 2023) TaxID=2976432 RepID=A0ABT2I0L6_9SPHN|nr:response regulator [Novosphingobium mangrovi (ex Huang et al. 2023)]MCT2398347.1 response regulator [Novosphingobium mangrovi (ex Huang et al. 2023)]
MTHLPSPDAKPRIIVVEDNVAVRRSLLLLLHGRGWDVRAYSSARSMLDDPQADSATCLVADYRLADLDGVELLNQLRERGWQGQALLVTGYPSPELENAAYAAGYAQVIEKPVGDLTLPETIRRLIETNPS